MAIYHFSVKPIQRSQGRSATAAAAYRAGVEITDERTGLVFDYSKRGGVLETIIATPAGAPAWSQDRAALWNAAEHAERRKDGTPAREYIVALPHELDAAQRRALVVGYVQAMAQREGCAVDVALHAPDTEGDQRNYHAHILRSTRVIGPDGFGAKLETEQAGRRRADDLRAARELWAEHVNAALRDAGISARVDHRSFKDQGITDALPTTHLGPDAVAVERKTGKASRRRQECPGEQSKAIDAELRELLAERAKEQAAQARREAEAQARRDVEQATRRAPSMSELKQQRDQQKRIADEAAARVQELRHRMDRAIPRAEALKARQAVEEAHDRATVARDRWRAIEDAGVPWWAPWRAYQLKARQQEYIAAMDVVTELQKNARAPVLEDLQRKEREARELMREAQRERERIELEMLKRAEPENTLQSSAKNRHAQRPKA